MGHGIRYLDRDIGYGVGAYFSPGSLVSNCQPPLQGSLLSIYNTFLGLCDYGLLGVEVGLILGLAQHLSPPKSGADL